MKRFVKILVGLAIFAFAVAVAALLWVTRPQAEKSAEQPEPPVVEFHRATYQTLSFDIPSQGLVQATRRTQLAAEVGGRVVDAPPRFEVGRTVKKGELLLQIDETDYLAARAEARAALADAESALASEKARAEQARRDWEKLGRGGEPSPLTLREPQVHSATRRVEAARAALERAKKDVERTSIEAPFEAVVASKDTELGNTLTPGAVIGEIFATSPFEVRLPLSVDEVPFLKSDDRGNLVGSVTVRASAAGSTREWDGEIVRTEGEIDRASRSVYAVARIESGPDAAAFRLQPGLFVEASIGGRPVPHVAAVPFSAFLDLERVAVIDPDDRLRFRTVDVVFRKDETVYVAEGLEEGARVCLTELPGMVEGIEVTPRPAETDPPEATGGDEDAAKSIESQPEPKP